MLYYRISVAAVAALLSASALAQSNRVSPPGGQIVDAATPPTIAADQVSTAAHPVAAGPQVYRGNRTAQSPAPLSTPADGRRQGVVRVTGHDRCDPAASQPVQPVCRRPIEARAGEFAKPSGQRLSPEQRLLVDQRLRDAPSSAQAAVKRIGRNDVDADASDAQTVAALVLTPTPVPGATKEVDAALGDAADSNPAVVEAVVQAIVTSGNTNGAGR